MAEDLKVQIPARFRKALERRFDSNRAIQTEVGRGVKSIEGMGWTIYEECTLCAFYDCPECPFGSFGPKLFSRIRCLDWIEKVLGEDPVFNTRHSGKVFWKADDLARSQLAKLQERAKQLIEWI